MQEDEGDAGAQVMGHLPVVRPTILVGIDTGVTHNVGGTEFRRARIGAFMSRAILRAAGFPATHLANVGASALDACDLPEVRKRGTAGLLAPLTINWERDWLGIPIVWASACVAASLWVGLHEPVRAPG